MWCEERKGGEVIPGRKGVGGSLRPGQTIPDTAPPPPTEVAHQGTTAARQGHPQALTPANLALEGPEVQIVTLGNNLLRGGIYCATLDHCTVLSAKLTERIVVT